MTTQNHSFLFWQAELQQEEKLWSPTPKKQNHRKHSGSFLPTSPDPQGPQVQPVGWTLWVPSSDRSLSSAKGSPSEAADQPHMGASLPIHLGSCPLSSHHCSADKSITGPIGIYPRGLPPCRLGPQTNLTKRQVQPRLTWPPL